jgi:hypothetical protein
VKVKGETWNTHQWLSNPRCLAIEPSNAVLHHHCVRCGRDFVSDPSSNGSYAVFVSAISFDRLQDEALRALNLPSSRKPPNNAIRLAAEACEATAFAAG